MDAHILVEVFKIEPAEVLPALDHGIMTSLCQKGIDEDEGRWRLTFYHAGRALRLKVDSAGNSLAQARFDAPRGQRRA